MQRHVKFGCTLDILDVDDFSFSSDASSTVSSPSVGSMAQSLLNASKREAEGRYPILTSVALVGGRRESEELWNCASHQDTEGLTELEQTIIRELKLAKQREDERADAQALLDL